MRRGQRLARVGRPAGHHVTDLLREGSPLSPQPSDPVTGTWGREGPSGLCSPGRDRCPRRTVHARSSSTREAPEAQAHSPGVCVCHSCSRRQRSVARLPPVGRGATDSPGRRASSHPPSPSSRRHRQRHSSANGGHRARWSSVLRRILDLGNGGNGGPATSSRHPRRCVMANGTPAVTPAVVGNGQCSGPVSEAGGWGVLKWRVHG